MPSTSSTSQGFSLIRTGSWGRGYTSGHSRCTVPPASSAMSEAARRAASLIAELAGGTVHREWPDVYPRPQEPVRIRLKPWLVDEVLGIHVPLEEAETILIRLGFHVKVLGDGEWDVLPPVFRLDATIPEDLVDEVGRVWGSHHVPPP